MSLPPGMDPETTTLAQAWAWMASPPENRIEDGVGCLLCGRLAKVYRRPITSASAAALIVLYRYCRSHPGEYVHWPTLLKATTIQRADETKLRYWELVEGEPGDRPDGSPRNGYWRITRAGCEFVAGRTRYSRYALVYRGAVLSFTDHQKDGKYRPPVTILDALGNDFNYDKLMAGES